MDIGELRRQADSGSTVAQCILGICYLDGIDAPVDYPEALRLLHAAVEGGASRAMWNLARLHAESIAAAQADRVDNESEIREARTYIRVHS